MVVVGAGVKPDVMLAQKAGLEIDDDDGGIRLRRDAADLGRGDLCRWRRLLLRQQGARTAAPRRALGRGDAAGDARRGLDDGGGRAVRGGALLLQRSRGLGRASSTSGPATEWDEVIWRGDRDAGEFAVFYSRTGRSRGRSRSSARRSWRTRGRCWRRASTSAGTRPRRCSGTPTAIWLSSPQARLPGAVAGPGVMATRLSLELEFGVRVPGAQFRGADLILASAIARKRLIKSWSGRLVPSVILATLRGRMWRVRHLVVLAVAVGAGSVLSACGGDSSPETPIVVPTATHAGSLGKTEFIAQADSACAEANCLDRAVRGRRPGRERGRPDRPAPPGRDRPPSSSSSRRATPTSTRS